MKNNISEHQKELLKLRVIKIVKYLSGRETTLSNRLAWSIGSKYDNLFV